MKIKRRYLIYSILLILFLIGMFVRTNMVGMPEDYPGNLKAGNAFYHTTISSHVAEGENVFTFPPYLGEGHSDIINSVGQHQALIIGSLINLTGIEDWRLAVLIVAIFSSLSIPLIFLLAKKVFKSDMVGLMSATLMAVPFNMGDWLYYTYIGIWLQSSGMTLILASLLLIYLNYEEITTWKLIALGLVSTALFLMFPVGGLITFPLLLLILVKVIRQKKDRIKNILHYAIFPIIAFFIAFPLYLAGKLGGSSVRTFEIQSIKEIVATHPFVTNFSGFPWIITVLFIVGMLLILSNYKKYKEIIIFLVYYFALLFLVPYIAPATISLYLVRMWATLPFVVFPIVAYAVYFIIDTITKKANISKLLIILVIISITLIAGLVQANTLKDNLQGEHMTKAKYLGIKWIQENSDEDDKIFMLEGAYQGEVVYTKRLTYIVSISELQKKVTELFNTEQLSFIFGQEWSTVARWSTWKQRTGYLSYEEYPPLNNTQDIRTFDYIFLQNLDEATRTYNEVMIKVLTENLGFESVYNRDQIVILKNGE